MKIKLTVMLAMLHLAIIASAQVAHPERRITVQYHKGAYFEKVIRIKKQSTDTLRMIVEKWAVATFNSVGDVIKIRTEDAIGGEGVEQGIVLATFPRVMGNLKYAFQIQFGQDVVYFRMYNLQIHTELDHTYPFEDYVFDDYGCEATGKQARAVKDHATRIANVLVNSLRTFFTGYQNCRMD
jgi:hypothetical protein